MYNCASVLAKVPLLQDVDKGFLSAVVMALRKMLVPQFEVLILEREAPAALFFINQGGVYLRIKLWPSRLPHSRAQAACVLLARALAQLLGCTGA